MFLTKLKRNASLLLGAGIVSLMMVGCGTDGASDVGTVEPPAAGDLITINATNADKVLASSIGGIGKIAGMIDDLVDSLPELGIADSKIAQASSGTNIDGSMAVSDDTLAITLVSRDCADGGSISVDGVSTSGGSVTFKHCQERGIVLDGSAEISVSGGTYSARFTDLNAGFSTGSLYLSDAGFTDSGDSFDFAIASGEANIQGIQIELKNFSLNKNFSNVIVNSWIKTDCMGGWVDVATTVPLVFDSSDLLVGGTLTITGNNSNMLVSVNADGTINAYLNDVLYANYNSAVDLPQYNAVCP